MNSVFDGLLEWFFGVLSHWQGVFETNLPQITSFLDRIPFVGDFLLNVSNSELLLILVFGVAIFYINKGKWLAELVSKYSWIAFVLFIGGIVIGVINL
jgi:hypothetical protein